MTSPDNQLSWEDAYVECAGSGYTLLTVESQELLTYIAGQFGSSRRYVCLASDNQSEADSK